MIPFLIKNPNCSGCSEEPFKTDCQNLCSNYITNTDEVIYDGEDLPAIGVKKCDSFTVVLQKINEALAIITTTSTTTI